MSISTPVFSLTIFAYRKVGMEEEEYHQYLSQSHAQLLKDLLVKNKIVGYTMQHNTTERKKLMQDIFPPGSHAPPVADYDCIIQIQFNDIQDYLNVQADQYFKEAVAPDHFKFADLKRSQMVTGWFETHVANGQAL